MPESNSNGKKEFRLNKGLVTAIPCLLVSLAALYCSRTYPGLYADYMLVSAAFFPTVVSVVAIVCSVLMLVKAFLKPEYAEPLTAEQKKGYLRGILTILDCLVYVLIFKKIGYIVSTIAALFALMVIFGNRKWVPMVIISIVLPILLYLAFHYLLQTNLPIGILTFLE